MHDSVIEWSWLLLSLMAFSISIWNLKSCIETQAGLDLEGINGRSRMTIGMHTRSEQFRIAISFVMIVVAIFSLLTAPPPPSYLTLPQSLAGMIAWNAVAGLLAVWSMLDRKVRRNIANYAEVAQHTRERKEKLHVSAEQ